MRNLLFLGVLFWSISTFSQVAQDTIAKAPNRFIVTAKVDEVLQKRADCYAQTKTSLKYYHIQLYNGQNINRARSIKAKFNEDFPGIYAVVEWESPEFKVWVGEYENKLKADQALMRIRKKYPNAFIVNPKK